MTVKYRLLPTREYLESVMDYDLDKGLMFWKVRPLEFFKDVRQMNRLNTILAGKEASHIRVRSHKQPYKYVNIDGHAWLTHRLLMVLGGYDRELLRTKMIDHINGDTLDNRWDNLRVTDNTGNQRNKQTSEDNVFGVKYVENRGKWYASIYHGSQHIHLGTFDNKQDAVRARKSAEKELGYHSGHGRPEMKRNAMSRLLVNYFHETNGESPKFNLWFLEKYVRGSWSDLGNCDNIADSTQMVNDYLIDIGCIDTIPKRVAL